MATGSNNSYAKNGWCVKKATSFWKHCVQKWSALRSADKKICLFRYLLHDKTDKSAHKNVVDRTSD